VVFDVTPSATVWPAPSYMVSDGLRQVIW